MADLFPQVAAEFVTNLDRTHMSPNELRASSQQRCRWRCANCSAEWEATVANRTSGRGCVACANRSRANARRTPTEATGTAAGRAWFPIDELRENLTNPGLGLEDLKPNSIDRCVWSCSICNHTWQATVVNRITKRSGCPICSSRKAGDRRSTAPYEASLLHLHPDVAAQFVENLDIPSRKSDEIWPGSNAMCRWRCARGHEWTTTPASRVAGTGCARCSGRGQSRLEFEVAEMLRLATKEHIELDRPVKAGGRTWRIDLAIPRTGLLIDLDPERWHKDHHRDQRKATALHELEYVRVRPESLPRLVDATVMSVRDNCADAYEWACAIRTACERTGSTWAGLTLAERGLALAAAATRWRETISGRPARSATDVAPHLEHEFQENLTRPGVSLPGCRHQRKTRADGCVEGAAFGGPRALRRALAAEPTARPARKRSRQRSPVPDPSQSRVPPFSTSNQELRRNSSNVFPNPSETPKTCAPPAT